MTDLELAKIEADELHPLYAVACEEIDSRTQSKGKRHAIDAIHEQDEWDTKFEQQCMREMDALWDSGWRSNEEFVSPIEEEFVPFY
jgi:hypothetical protein